MLRPLTPADLDFLLEMVVETINWKPGRNANLAEVLADERMERYVKDWGRAGHCGIIAELDDQPVGAVWCRNYTCSEPAYGYVADDVTEIAISLAPAARGKGLGRKLIQAAKAELGKTVPRISLSVEDDNYARKLYESEGFVVVEQDDNDITMVCDVN